MTPQSTPPLSASAQAAASSGSTLRRAGLLALLLIVVGALAGLVPRLGNTQISDPAGRYVSTEMAGYGFVVNPGAL